MVTGPVWGGGGGATLDLEVDSSGVKRPGRETGGGRRGRGGGVTAVRPRFFSPPFRTTELKTRAFHVCTLSIPTSCLRSTRLRCRENKYDPTREGV